MGGRGGLDAERGRIAAGGRRRLAQLADEPADEVGVAELEDDPVRDAAGHGDRHRAVAGDPHGQRPAARPREAQVRALVRDRLAGHERADDPDRLLGVGQRDRRLAQHPTGGVAAADAEVHPAVGDLVERGQQRGGHRRLAGARVRHAGPETQPRGRAGHEREQRIGVAPQDVAVEQPAVREPGGLGLAGQRERPLDRVVGLEGETELHRRPLWLGTKRLGCPPPDSRAGADDTAYGRVKSAYASGRRSR